MTKKNIKIYSETLDFLRLKIDDSLYNYIESISYYKYDKYSFKDLNINDFKGLILFNKYYIINFGLISGGDLHRFDIVDKYKNKYGNICYALKIRKNLISYIELSGFFYKINDLYDKSISYDDFHLLDRYLYLKDFINYFKIDIYKNNLIKRLDYNIDIIGLEAFQVMDYLNQDKNLIGTYTDDITGIDLKNILDKSKKRKVKHGIQATGLTISGTYNNIVIYDKILDILKNYMNRTIKGINPDKHYIDSKYPITRIEIQKKGSGLQHFKYSSIFRVLKNTRSLYYDYIKTLFIIDFSKFSKYEPNSINGKVNFLAKEKKVKSLLHAVIMFRAFGNSIKKLSNDKFFINECFKHFPELMNKSDLTFIDDFYIKDLFDGIE